MNKFSEYKNEIELIQNQNPGFEHELYSIVAYILRVRDGIRYLSLRDITHDRKSENTNNITLMSRLGEVVGPADFVILSREYNFINPSKDLIYGACEIKAISDYKESDFYQLERHLKYYKKVIYTNGLEWRFYDKSKVSKNCINWENEFVWSIKLEKILDCGFEIDWSQNAECLWDKLLKKLNEIVWIDSK